MTIFWSGNIAQIDYIRLETFDVMIFAIKEKSKEMITQRSRNKQFE